MEINTGKQWREWRKIVLETEVYGELASAPGKKEILVTKS